MDFYGRAGFEAVGTIRGYYKRIEPPDCFVLAKAINAPEGTAPRCADLLADVKNVEWKA